MHQLPCSFPLGVRASEVQEVCEVDRITDRAEWPWIAEALLKKPTGFASPYDAAIKTKRKGKQMSDHIDYAAAKTTVKPEEKK